MFAPRAFLRSLRSRFAEPSLPPHGQLNMRGVTLFPPGHYASPLLDIDSLDSSESLLAFDGPQYWEHVELQEERQRSYFEKLLRDFPVFDFPATQTEQYRYYSNNDWFPLSDAFALSGILRSERPRRLIEVGSGFSSAVVLDTFGKTRDEIALTFIEPFPERLQLLLSERDWSSTTIIEEFVQKLPLSTFDALRENDVLFIDSSHVAKIGSDVVFLLLQVLPRLNRGVIVHFHDIYYPYTYPTSWIRQGRAWNESLFLRSFLVGNRDFEILAFNSFARARLADIFSKRMATFLEDTGSSIWLRKVS